MSSSADPKLEKTSLTPPKDVSSSPLKNLALQQEELNVSPRSSSSSISTVEEDASSSSNDDNNVDYDESLIEKADYAYAEAVAAIPPDYVLVVHHSTYNRLNGIVGILSSFKKALDAQAMSDKQREAAIKAAYSSSVATTTSTVTTNTESTPALIASEEKSESKEDKDDATEAAIYLKNEFTVVVLKDDDVTVKKLSRNKKEKSLIALPMPQNHIEKVTLYVPGLILPVEEEIPQQQQKVEDDKVPIAVAPVAPIVHYQILLVADQNVGKLPNPVIMRTQCLGMLENSRTLISYKLVGPNFPTVVETFKSFHTAYEKALPQLYDDEDAEKNTAFDAVEYLRMLASLYLPAHITGVPYRDTKTRIIVCNVVEEMCRQYASYPNARIVLFEDVKANMSFNDFRNYDLMFPERDAASKFAVVYK
jgi:hypothetical protein